MFKLLNLIYFSALFAKTVCRSQITTKNKMLKETCEEMPYVLIKNNSIEIMLVYIIVHQIRRIKEYLEQNELTKDLEMYSSVTGI